MADNIAIPAAKEQMLNSACRYLGQYKPWNPKVTIYFSDGGHVVATNIDGFIASGSQTIVGVATEYEMAFDPNEVTRIAMADMRIKEGEPLFDLFMKLVELYNMTNMISSNFAGRVTFYRALAEDFPCGSIVEFDRREVFEKVLNRISKDTYDRRRPPIKADLESARAVLAVTMGARANNLSEAAVEEEYGTLLGVAYRITDEVNFDGDPDAFRKFFNDYKDHLLM